MSRRTDKHGDERGSRSVKSADRVLDLLEAIGKKPEGTTFSRLHADLHIPKSSLHAILTLLRSRDYIEIDDESRRISLGVRVWETGFAYQQHHGVLKHSRAILEDIVAAVNETAQFAKLVGTENVYLDKVDSTHALRLQSDVGGRLPAHATGIGKVLLAQLDNREIRKRLGREELPSYTPNTLATVTDLIDELEVIRQRGFGIDNEEYTVGVFCVAVPVYDTPERATTALSVSVPVMRVSLERLSTALANLARGSLRLTQRAGLPSADRKLMLLADPVRAAIAITNMAKSGRYELQFADTSAVGEGQKSVA